MHKLTLYDIPEASRTSMLQEAEFDKLLTTPPNASGSTLQMIANYQTKTAEQIATDRLNYFAMRYRIAFAEGLHPAFGEDIRIWISIQQGKYER